jgi:hypothetical protein
VTSSSLALSTEPAVDSVAEAEEMARVHLAREQEVERVATLVRWLDDAIKIPGTNLGVGLDAAVGFFVPVVGDAVTGLASLTVLTAAMRRGVPRVVLARMLLNVVIDVVVGLIPGVGDIFDLVWRSNRRNLDLMLRHQGELEPKPRAGDYAIVAAAGVAVVASLAAPIFLIAWLFSLLAG